MLSGLITKPNKQNAKATYLRGDLNHALISNNNLLDLVDDTGFVIKPPRETVDD